MYSIRRNKKQETCYRRVATFSKEISCMSSTVQEMNLCLTLVNPIISLEQPKHRDLQ